MNKTFNINIGGTVFNVDEDAYELLHKYLESIKLYFSKIDKDGEIIFDIESRIAENFLSKLSNKNISISLSDVKNVIKIMGTLDDFKEIYDDESKEEETFFSNGKDSKRLNRDTSDKVIAGVASGISNYFQVDPIIIRIIFLASLFVGGFGFFAYIICWIGIPAKDGSDQTITKRYYRDIDDKVIGGVAMGIAKYLSVDVSIIRILFIVSIFFGGFGIIVYFILWFITPEARTVGEKMSMTGYAVTLENVEKFIKEKINPENKEENIFMKIILFPFRLIGPLLNGFIKLIVPIIRILLSFILFGFSVAIIVLTVFFALNQLEIIDHIPAHIIGRIQDIDFQLDGINLAVIFNEIPFAIICSIYLNLFLTLTIIIMMITKFLFNRELTKLPISITIFFVWLFTTLFNLIALPVIAEKWHDDGLIDEWIETGVIENYSKSQTYTKTFDIKDFEGVKISIPANVVIKESDKFSVTIDATEKEFKNLLVESSWEGDMLKIYSDRTNWRWNDWKGSDKTSIVIEMPNINTLHASAASNTDIEFSVIEDITIKLSGASDLDLNSDVSNLNASVSGASDINIEGNIINSIIKMSGASEVDIEGEGDNLVLRLSGASTFNGREFKVSLISLIGSGASTAHINSTDKISVDASSASRIFHYGTGSIDDFDLSSSASFKSIEVLMEVPPTEQPPLTPVFQQ
jgi:phage shock protein PspC (stress-responsive transcriptional regulator)